MDKYVAVIRRKPGEDIEHWKYIKREKKNGKWRYTYDKDSASSDVKKKQEKYDAAVKATDPKLSSPNPKIEYEKKIVENVIKEHVISEDIIKENIITEDFLKENKLTENELAEKIADKIVDVVNDPYIKKDIAEASLTINKTIADGEKWIHDNVLDTKVGDVAAEVIGRAEEFVTSILGSLGKKLLKRISNEKKK